LKRYHDAEKARQQRSRIVQNLNVEEKLLGGQKHWRGFSVRQDLFEGRTAHTKCGLYLLGSSLAAALLDGLFEHPPPVPSVRAIELCYAEMFFQNPSRAVPALLRKAAPYVLLLTGGLAMSHSLA
jgi:hypothetical protein